ncbi:MAG TPA: NAD(P)-dependent oxidoreductase, partial [Kofleriaceae bacterium]
MRILLTFNLPRSVRGLAEALVPAGCSLDILPASHAGFADALAAADCLMGLSRARYDAAFLAGAPRLALIQLLRAGHELVDLAAAERAGIRVANIADTTSAAVAEHCLMLMLALCRRLRWQHDAVIRGDWFAVKPWQLPSGDVDSVPEVQFDGLAGRTLGLLGLGPIGARVARLATAFGM